MTTIDRFDPFERRITEAIDEIAAARQPDYLDAALQQTARARQRPRWAFPERWLPMNRLTIASAGVVLVVVIALGGLALTSSNPRAGASPSPTAAVAPSPNAPAAAASIPASLQGRWLGATRPSIIAGGDGADLLLSSTGMVITQGGATNIGRLPSSASVAGQTLRVEMTSAALGCRTGDVGTYSWSLSASGETLTLANGQDPCAARQAAFSGTWWRMDCRAPDGDFCLGLLDAGTYPTRAFQATERRGVTFTVPDGWANAGDWPGLFTLSLAADFSATTAAYPDPAAEVEVIADIQPESQLRPCSNEVQAGVATTPAAIAAWLETVPGLEVVRQPAGSVDGNPAIVLDMGVGVAPKATCEGGNPIVETLMSSAWGTGPYTFGLAPGQGQRLFLFTVSGHVTAVILHTDDANRFRDFLQRAMPVIESFHFQ